jgi:hypothetical protein
MKTHNHILITTIVVSLWFGLAGPAFGFYDPSVQRWINRDPIHDGTGPLQQDIARASVEENLSVFVRNDPSTAYDVWGLWTASGSHDGKSDTIECDGNDRVRVYLTPTTLAACEPAALCRKVHEEVHKNEALAENPTICKGKPRGTLVWNYPGGMKKSELRAYDKEIACAQALALCFYILCDETAEEYIKRLQNDRKQYE